LFWVAQNEFRYFPIHDVGWMFPSDVTHVERTAFLLVIVEKELPARRTGSRSSSGRRWERFAHQSAAVCHEILHDDWRPEKVVVYSSILWRFTHFLQEVRQKHPCAGYLGRLLAKEGLLAVARAFVLIYVPYWLCGLSVPA
jgi:hypothetical protein